MRYGTCAWVVAMAVAGVVRGEVSGPAYSARVLSSRVGGNLYLTGINNNGQVSGYSEKYSSSQGWQYQVIRFVDGVGYGSVLGKGWGINDQDTIVGEGRVGAKYGAYYESPSQGTHLVSDPYMFYGRAIANGGLVAGESYEGGWGTGVLTWKPGQVGATNFGRPMGSDSVTVKEVNEWGTVIGEANKNSVGSVPGWTKAYYITTVEHPIPGPGEGQVWTPEFHTLPRLASVWDEEYTKANDINENGLVVGQSDGQPVIWRTRPLVGTGTAPSAFEVKAVGLGSLGSDPEWSAGEALGVDNKNRVVGWSYSDEGQRGFLYLNGRLVDLNSMFSGSAEGAGEGVVIKEAVGINDRGQIIAYGSYGNWGGGYSFPLLLEPNYGATQEVPLPAAPGGIVDGRLVGRFTDVASGQWFDPDPTGHVRVVMESASLFTDILELPYGFGELTVSVEGSVLGVFHAGDAVDLGGVSEFEVAWTGEEGTEYADFPLKLAFGTETASFRVESWAVVPEPGVAGMIGLVAIGMVRRRRG